jgi:hypothetical protein
MMNALVDAICTNSELGSRTAKSVEADHNDQMRIPSLRGGYIKAVQFWNKGFGSRPPLRDWRLEDACRHISKANYYHIKTIALEYNQLGQEEFERRYVTGGAFGFTKVWMAIVAARKKDES